MAHFNTDDAEMVGESIARMLSSMDKTKNVVRRCSGCMYDYMKSAQHTCKNVYHTFTEHPHEHRMSYCSHMMRSFHTAYHLGRDSLYTCIHAVFPFLCKKIGIHTVDHLDHTSQYVDRKRTLE
jgi:Family of unknown function (DUF6356)